MADHSMMTRRLILGAGLSAPLVSAFGPADPLAGVEAYSESVQIGLASLDGSCQVVARLCRYPDHNVGWTWVQVLTPDGFFAQFDHHAPCSSDRTPIGEDSVSYAVQGSALLSATRSGPRLAPSACSMRVEARLAATGDPREAEGWVPFSAEIEIEPTRRYSGLLPDRSEVFGAGRMAIELNGRRYEVEGFGQFHEQPQTAPRFAQTYGYASLWGPVSGVTIVASPRGGGGYRVSETTTEEFRAADLGLATADERAILLSDGSGTDLPILATPRIRQSIPIFNGVWRGQFVRAAAGDETLYGVVVDFS